MVQDWPRDAVPRHQSYSQPRYPTETYDQRRYYDGSAPGPVPENARQPPMAIDQALRTHCGISGKQYFVAVLLEDGTPATFFSPGQKLEEQVLGTFFDARRFQHVTRELCSSKYSQHLLKVIVSDLLVVPSQSTPFGGFGDPYARSNRYGSDRRRPGDDGDDDDMHSRSARKRYRSGQYEDEGPRHQLPVNRRKIRVQDSAGLWNFYDGRFKSCQQSACKLIAKAWVKAVEPKKQSTHPYTGSDEKAPGWWPKPWGNTKEDKVRHKEPDHLYKRERVHLLNHILSLVVEPNEKQHPDVKKLQLNVKKLEECTNEALSGFYAESPTNSSKKQFLNEIFKVARQQERYKNGEIDGAMEVYVLDSDRSMDDPTSENDGGSFSRDDDDQNTSPSTRSNNTQGFLQTPVTGHSPASNPHGAQFLNELPMRNSQQAPPVLHDIGAQHHDFVNNSMPVNGTATINPPGPNMGVDMVASPQDRKPSVYGDYGNGGMYAQHWQPSTTSSEAHQPLYAPQNNQPPPSFVPPVPVSHPQSYVANFETMPRQGYDPSNGQMFRPADVPQAPVGGQQGYNYALPGVSEVIDSVPHKPDQYYYNKG